MVILISQVGFISKKILLKQLVRRLRKKIFTVSAESKQNLLYIFTNSLNPLVTLRIKSQLIKVEKKLKKKESSQALAREKQEALSLYQKTGLTQTKCY